MMQFKKISNEVFYTNKTITQIEDRDIAFLKANVKNTEKKRIRLCMHLNEKDSTHEMFIVLSNKTYIRPHKHLSKSESLHVLEGSADVIFFDNTGKITKIISLSDASSKSCFYYRINEPTYHTFIVKSDIFIFHETTQGPFRKSDTIYAPWSPKENDFDKITKFFLELKESVKTFID
jgi:cupin fold WbuC family metalloprotein|tara:strand:- start:2725 stop:3255 length:531 start_codon:yes stop_codon:yes gene_type:complete